MVMAVSDERINQLFATTWEIAARHDPILLAKHQDRNIIVRARERIGELLAAGCSVTETRDRILNELLDPNSQLYQKSH
jgi:hypothetical protein